MSRAERARRFDAEEMYGARETELCVGLRDRIHRDITDNDSEDEAA